MIGFRAYLFSIVFFVSLFSLHSSMATELDPLPVEEAFILKAGIEPKTGEITLEWKIAPGTYLYQNKIHVYNANPNKKEIQLDLPKPTLLPDPLLGDQWVYKQNLMLGFKAPALKSNASTLSIQYQGCATGGFCYPPQTLSYRLEKKNTIFSLSRPSDLPADSTHTENHANSSLHDSAIQALQQANLPTQLALFYLIGLLLAFTPCVLPMLPILASVIITEEKLSTLKGFFLSLSYVLSMATTYALAGILAVKMGQSIQIFFQNIWVVGIFSLFFVYLGLVQLEKLPLRLPSGLMNAFHQLNHKQQGGHILGAIILGFLGTLISSPCVTAPLVATLSYISQTGNEALGGSSLFVMGLGMGTPMIILGTLGGRFIPNAGKWTQLVNELFAILLFGLAIWIIKSVLPPSISMGLWGLLGLIAGYFMGFFNKRKYRHLPKVGMVIFVYGLILILGACFGQTNPLRPYEFLNKLKRSPPQSSLKANPSFITITTLDSLHAELEKHANKLILIKFYADWCASCKQMEVELFQDPEIVHALTNWVLIKADITENRLPQREFMKAYQVFAPPSIYLFKSNNPADFIQFHGETDKKEFMDNLTSFIKK